MANNYTPSYNQYRTQTAGYALPSSVRTYSVFDPASNSWRRMTNDGRSPMPASPAQQQADIAGALAQAKQTQGTVYPVQGMGQGQPVEMHPRYMNPPAQNINIPSRQTTRPLARNNTRVNTRPKISDYNNDDAILKVADIPPEVTLGAQPIVVAAPINMSPDHRTPTPYVSNETAGLAGYNPNIAMSPVALTTTGKQAPVVDFPEYVDSPITRDLLRLGRGFKRLFSRPSMAEEATAALRASTGLPPLK